MTLSGPIRGQYSPDDISGGLVLHGSVDQGDQGDVGHVADVGVDQELEVGDVDQRQVAANRIHALDKMTQGTK